MLASRQDGWPLIIDASRVGFITSAGLHTLVKPRASNVVLVCPAGHVAHLLEGIVGKRLNGITARVNPAG